MPFTFLFSTKLDNWYLISVFDISLYFSISNDVVFLIYIFLTFTDRNRRSNLRPFNTAIVMKNVVSRDSYLKVDWGSLCFAVS